MHIRSTTRSRARNSSSARSAKFEFDYIWQAKQAKRKNPNSRRTTLKAGELPHIALQTHPSPGQAQPINRDAKIAHKQELQAFALPPQFKSTKTEIRSAQTQRKLPSKFSSLPIPDLKAQIVHSSEQRSLTQQLLFSTPHQRFLELEPSP